MRWQKRARWGLAAFGIVFAFVVYAAIGDRQTAAPAQGPARLDPRAVLESAGAVFQQFQAARQDYVIEAERQLAYEGGATKLIGVTIRVRQREGRDFVVSGREAQAGENQTTLEVTGDVKLAASDGFVATTDRATFNKDDATVRVAGPESAWAAAGGTGAGTRFGFAGVGAAAGTGVRAGVAAGTGVRTGVAAGTGVRAGAGIGVRAGAGFGIGMTSRGIASACPEA